MNCDYHQNTLSEIRALLKTEFSPDFIEIVDDSERHKNHKEAKKNLDKGHFILRISSAAFQGKTRIQQHRMIYKCLSPIMVRIHALNISVF